MDDDGYIRWRTHTNYALERSFIRGDFDDGERKNISEFAFNHSFIHSNGGKRDEQK